ncbi:MAG TPA: rhodanese-like domain-containing protein [Salinivirgaceae bacterium]|nr:rhodanese-like domain-containing protein [Salinivirgaceae bacterium]
MNYISPITAKYELECNQAVMIDVRDGMDYEFVSFDVNNVINIPSDKIAQIYNCFSKAKRIILADFDGLKAPLVARMLEENGYINIVVLEGGMKNWNSLKLPLVYNVDGGCQEDDCNTCRGCQH